MRLSFFTEEAYDYLFNGVKDNMSKYLQPDDDWWDSICENQSYFIQSTALEVSTFRPYCDTANKTDEQKSQEDLVNTRLLYDAFKTMTPFQASNKYMWTYQCHAVPENRQYILNRWTDLRENTIKTRFFVTNERESLFDNAIARLWWFGYLTYDHAKNSDDPYVFTKVLLTNQTICTDFLNTYNCRSVNRSRGVLSAIKEFKYFLGVNEGITEYFRACNKYLNRYAAITNLDCLEPDEIKQIALAYMVRLREDKKSTT